MGSPTSAYFKLFKANHRIAELEAENARLREALGNMVSLATPFFSDDSQMLALSEARAALAASDTKAAEKQEFLNDLTAFSQEVDP